MNTPDELRKIQLLEKRMMGADAHMGVATSGNSRGKHGSNSNSVDFVSGNATQSQIDFSRTTTTVKDSNSPIYQNGNSNDSVENKPNTTPSSSASNSKMKGGKLVMNFNPPNAQNQELPTFSASFDADNIEDSNHSISQISPLKAQPSAKYSAAKTRESLEPVSGEKRKNGSDSAVKDINSVLKHVDMPLTSVEVLRKEAEGPEPKQARTSAVTSSGATALEDSTSHSQEVNNAEKEGSRGATSSKRTIHAYFAPQSSSESHVNAQNNLTKIFGQGVSHSAASEKDSADDVSLISSISATTNSSALDSIEPAPLPAISSSSAGRGRKVKEMPPPAVVPFGAGLDKQTRKELDMLRAAKEQAENKVFRLETELTQTATKLKALEDRNLRVIRTLETVQRQVATEDARRRRDKLALDCVRLGKISTVRTTTTTVGEVWEEGFALKELNKRSEILAERREELTKRSKDLASLKRKTKAKAKAEMASTTYSTVDDDCELDFVAESEAITTHLNQLKKDETALVDERRLFDAEKAAHQKELKRCQSEDKSRFFKTLPCLNDRYLLMSMLGRGGFSEVWKALDLIELREVAIKIHQLNSSWGEDRKTSYIRHVTREYTIHREMRHPRVVQLFDVFEIDSNSFATVLELCRGIDLDEKLKRCRQLPEKDARTILLQIVSGLRYLNMPSSSTEDESGREHGLGGNAGGSTAKRMSIIHYDLKPANILFDDNGDAKITDFGLSKIIDDSTDDESLELTSQGAGTYWYLPPECFAKGDERGGPRVSSKVDVWSVGVIFYQMLYGKRPFGEGKSQENVLREGVILNATQVEYPVNGFKVSDEAKEFIRACLTHSKEHRPDVHALCLHSYLSSKTKV